jgi:sortase A
MVYKSGMGTNEGRLRLSWRKLCIAAAAALACAGVGGWALTAEDTPSTSDDPIAERASAEATTTSTAPPTTAAPTTTTEAPLPVPEPAPAEAYAPTPEVVHGTLSLPSIGVEQELHEGVTLTAIDRGPSHWPGTAMPGQVGNVVVAGHRVTNTRPFYDLDLLQPGDPLVFTMSDGTTWTYELTSTEIVEPNAMHIVEQTRERTATLFACHPKHSAAQRIVAHFRLVPS